MGEIHSPVGTIKATSAFVMFSGTRDSANVNFTMGRLTLIRRLSCETMRMAVHRPE
jgi:hypothetical protein